MNERPTKPARRSDRPRRGAETHSSSLAMAAQSGEGQGVLMYMREWLDALIIAFVLAMFIRSFVVELFKIPSGSMSPTLLGDFVAEGAAIGPDAQEHYYLIIRDRDSQSAQVFMKDPRTGRFTYEGTRWFYSLTSSIQNMVQRNLHLEEHRIFVNKFAYWFEKPSRGDIVVFRVPFSLKSRQYVRNGRFFEVKPYNRNQSVYVKRAVAFGGEEAEIRNNKRLYIDGKLVEEPKVFQHLRYSTTDMSPTYSVKVPPGEAMLFGDNTDHSYDSRYWGGVPYANLRGKAFFRYWPMRKMRFLNN